MFYIIKLGYYGDIVVDHYEYIDHPKTIEIKRKGSSKKYEKRKFDVITDHNCISRGHYCIYTLDHNKIEDYKKNLQNFYMKKWYEEIRVLQHKMNKLMSVEEDDGR
jgi:hypothetical protein